MDDVIDDEGANDRPPRHREHRLAAFEERPRLVNLFVFRVCQRLASRRDVFVKDFEDFAIAGDGGVDLFPAKRKEIDARLVEQPVAEPMGEEALARHLDEAADIAGLLRELAESYAGRGVNLVRLAGG